MQWLLAVLLFGGGLGAATLRSRRGRITVAALAGFGLAGTIAAWVLAAIQPGAAPYTVRITSPAQNAAVSSPVTVTVCGFYADGTRVPATDSQHYLIVFVDGMEVAALDRWRITESLSTGTHTIKTELVTQGHHAFAPPQIAQVTFAVQPPLPGSALSLPASC